MSRIGAALTLMVGCAGCSPIPRWSYLAETRVEPLASANAFSADDMARAKRAAADVAAEIGMKSADDLPGELELERRISAAKKPPRLYLIEYTGKMSMGLPIRLRVEISDDGRALYFSVSDYERGTARPVVRRIRKLMMENVEAAFPDASIVHEAWSLGPFFDLHP